MSLISTAELDSLLETVYLLGTHANAVRLLDALERAKSGTNQLRSVDSLRQEFGFAEAEKRPA